MIRIYQGHIKKYVWSRLRHWQSQLYQLVRVVDCTVSETWTYFAWFLVTVIYEQELSFVVCSTIYICTCIVLTLVNVLYLVGKIKWRPVSTMFPFYRSTIRTWKYTFFRYCIYWQWSILLTINVLKSWKTC